MPTFEEEQKTLYDRPGENLGDDLSARLNRAYPKSASTDLEGESLQTLAIEIERLQQCNKTIEAIMGERGRELENNKLQLEKLIKEFNERVNGSQT